MKKPIVLVIVCLFMVACSSSAEKIYDISKQHYDNCYGDTSVSLSIGYFNSMSVVCHENKEQRDARKLAEKGGK